MDDEASSRSRAPGLVWFRRDLRLGDNPAWAAATSEHRDVVALFVLDPRLVDSAGPFRRAQLEANLIELDRALERVGGRLRVRRGDPAGIVPEEVARNQISSVYWNADISPFAVQRDERVSSALRDRSRVTTPYGNLVLPPGAVLTRGGTISRVFAAFHRRWKLVSWDPWPEPGRAAVSDDPGEGLTAGGQRAPHMAGEDGAHKALREFLEGPIDDYRNGHDAIGRPATSDLSAHLKFGTISPRQIMVAVGEANADREAFVRQLAWRDWFAHLLSDVPSLVERSLRPEFDNIVWRNDPAEIEAWKTGHTGYPIVDAGMRELRATGAMHNRVRMVTASFLVKDLLADWRIGERFFRHFLSDGDVSQNVGNWQWVAGTGPDAAPYFRVFNPVTQSRTHDPGGRYIRKWLPELSGLDDRAIHAPWEAAPLDLAAADVILGTDYPVPVVDHAVARERTLATYKRARHASGR